MFIIEPIFFTLIQNKLSRTKQFNMQQVAHMHIISSHQFDVLTTHDLQDIAQLWHDKLPGATPLLEECVISIRYGRLFVPLIVQ